MVASFVRGTACSHPSHRTQIAPRADPIALMEPSVKSGASQSDASTSMSLLDLVRTHDEVAWRCMTELYGPLIYHWCRNAGLGADDAADILQDVFRSVVIHIATFEKTETGGSFRAWLWSITRNKIRDYFKVRAGKASATGGTDAHLHMLAIPDREPNDACDSSLVATSGLTCRVFELVQREVKETTWLAFWRTTIDDIAPVVVADELGISIESVWQAKSRVLRRARQLLE